MEFYFSIFYVHNCFIHTQNIVILASRADVAASAVYVRFYRYQQRTTASIRIARDDVVEKEESFVLKLILPTTGVRRNWLKYGRYRHSIVYIKDSK